MADKPVVDLSLPSRVRDPLPLTELEKEAFLAAMVKTRSVFAAAVAARPTASGGKSAWAAFKRLIDRDVDFRARFEHACVEALATVEEEIHRRALEGVVEYERFHDNGKVAERRIKYSDKLLLASAARLAQRVEPGAWDQKRQVEVTGGTVNTLELDVADLPRETRDKILEGIREKRRLAAAKDGNP